MSDSKKQTGALELVMLRNIFYRDSHRRALVGLLLLVLLNVLLLGAIIYKVSNPPKPEYFAATSDGRMITWEPLTAPAVSDDFVLQWTGNAVRKAFSLDYLHWRDQLQSASVDFTDFGWSSFLDALKKSNNLSTLTNLKMVSDATITGAPTILKKQVVDGRFAWKIQMPILVTYQNADRSIPVPMNVTVIVLRVPVQDNPNRISINNFLPVPTDSGADQALSD